MERRTFIATAGSAVAVGLAGCLDAGGNPMGEHEVGMTIDEFRPDELTVQPGTTVTFINTSSHAHTVTAFQDAYPEDAEYWASGGFESEQEARDAWSQDLAGNLYQDERYEKTFEYPGRYEYYCIPHYVPEQGTSMVGQIIVEEA